MSVAARLKELRLRSRQSLQEVADAIKVSKTHVWELEMGRTENPSLEMLTKLADHFKVPIRTLVGEDPESSEDASLVRMFRQVGELSAQEREILDDMIQSLRKRRAKNDPKD
jgi:transcriptional regulator with XRE-family HTH domain